MIKEFQRRQGGRPRASSLDSTIWDARQKLREWDQIKCNTKIPLHQQQTQQPPPLIDEDDEDGEKEESLREEARVGEYLLQHTLRHNKQDGAVLWVGVNERTRARYVLKIVDKTSRTQRALEQLRKEILVLSYLPVHRRIIHIHDVIEDDSRLCVVLPLAEGGDLFELIVANGGLPRSEAWRIFSQLAEGLAHAHSSGFIHRDIKPENIFLDRDNNILIGDWGFGTRWFSCLLKRRFYGSANYFAPEILKRQEYIGPEIDIFAAGVVLYGCLTGRLPFGSANREAAYRKRLENGDWTRHPILTSGETELLTRMFDPNPLSRITAPELLKICRQFPQPE